MATTAVILSVKMRMRVLFTTEKGTGLSSIKGHSSQHQRLLLKYSDKTMKKGNDIIIINDGWMGDLRFYVLFNSISVISGRWADHNERLCAITPFTVGRISPRAGIEHGLLDIINEPIAN